MSQGFTWDNSNIPIPVPVTMGGTGLTSTTANQILYAPNPNQIAQLASLSFGVITTDISSIPSTTLGQIPATLTNDNASAGNLGEVVTASVLYASGVTLTSGVPANVTSVSLTAGDWNVFGNCAIEFSSLNGVISQYALSITSATLPDSALTSLIYTPGQIQQFTCMPTPMLRVSISGTTTVYLVAQANHVSGTAKASGGIIARRAR